MCSVGVPWRGNVAKFSWVQSSGKVLQWDSSGSGVGGFCGSSMVVLGCWFCSVPFLCWFCSVSVRCCFCLDSSPVLSCWFGVGVFVGVVGSSLGSVLIGWRECVVADGRAATSATFLAGSWSCMNAGPVLRGCASGRRWQCSRSGFSCRLSELQKRQPISERVSGRRW